MLPLHDVKATPGSRGADTTSFEAAGCADVGRLKAPHGLRSTAARASLNDGSNDPRSTRGLRPAAVTGDTTTATTLRQLHLGTVSSAAAAPARAPLSGGTCSAGRATSSTRPGSQPSRPGFRQRRHQRLGAGRGRLRGTGLRNDPGRGRRRRRRLDDPRLRRRIQRRRQGRQGADDRRRRRRQRRLPVVLGDRMPVRSLALPGASATSSWCSRAM